MRLGTRGSALARVQADSVAATLRAAGAEVEIVVVTTLGDRGVAIADKSRWVSELERALGDGRVDLVVHSAKDVPTELADGCELVAAPARADARDVLCGVAGLVALAPGARVGTAAPDGRRTAQVLAARRDVEIVEVRGNVDTRLRKLAEGHADAIVLALAGLQRLGRADAATAVLDEFVPAAGQGTLALEARAGDLPDALLEAVNDPATMRCLVAERALVAALGATCHTPVGAHARPHGDGELSVTGWVGMPDGSEWLRDEVTGPADVVGGECARRMLAAGAGELLARATVEAVGGR